MKHTKLISAILAVAATVSLAGCNSDSGITVNSTDTSTQNISTSTTIASGGLDTSDSSNSAASNSVTSDSTSSTESSAAASSDNSSDTSSPADTNDDFTMPTIEQLKIGLPIELKGAEVPPAPGNPNDALPTALDFVKAVGDNIRAADSFMITGELDGLTNPINGGDLVPITEKYVFVATKTASYLRVAHEQNLDSDTVDGFTYEAYTVLNDDGTITTITRNGDKWIGSKSEEKLNGFLTEEEQYYRDHLRGKYQGLNYDRYQGYSDLSYDYLGTDIYSNAIATFGPLYLFKDGLTTTDRAGNADPINVLPIIHDDTGNFTMRINEFVNLNDLKDPNSYFYSSDKHFYFRFNNFFRAFPVHENRLGVNEWKIWSVNVRNTQADHTYTVDANNVLTELKGHGCDDPGFTNTTSYDITYDFVFSNWNNVATINVPDYTLA